MKKNSITSENHYKTRQSLKLWILLIFYFSGVLWCSAQTVRYVKEGGSGNGDSWVNASGDLQLMINNSAEGDSIFVASGTYKPNRPANDLFTIDFGNRNNAFVLKTGVKIYGGFVGTESSLGQRVLNTVAPSILSGDFDDNDTVNGSGQTLSIGNNGENAYHVVISCIASLDSIILDGFTVKGGNANGSGEISVSGNNITQNAGGGMHFLWTSVNINNCKISENSAQLVGGGVYTSSSSPNFSGCIIEKNLVTNAQSNGGGGIYNSYSSISIENCFFHSNTVAGALYSIGNGGAIFNAGNDADILIINSVFTENYTPYYGSCIYNLAGGSTILNSTFYNNKAAYGTLFNEYAGSWANVKNSIFYNNPLLAVNNILNYHGGGSATVSYSIVEGGYGGSGNLNVNPSFVNAASPAGEDGIPGTADDGLRLQNASPAINAGTYDSSLPATDILGNTRIYDNSVDIGAYEFLPSEIYVDASLETTGNGFSWASAFRNLSDALAVAETVNTIKTIYVSKGTYYPTGTQNGTDRNTTFLIPQRGGIEIYGGYPNGGGMRNIEENPTILSGDIGNAGDTSDNSYHVVVMTNSLPNAENVVLDGLIVTGGNANGGVQYTYHNIVTNQSEGGGILFRINDNIGENIIIRDSEITANSAITAGGLYLWKSSALIHNTVISGNSAVNNGGGIFIHETSSPRIVNSLIADNTAANGGGLFSSNAVTSLSIINSTIANNTAGNEGYNLHNNNGSTVNMANSIVWGKNVAKNIYNESTINASYSDILKENDVYAGMGNINENPVFVNSQNYIPMPCSPVIDAGNNTDINNAPTGSGTYDLEGNPRIFSDTVDMGAYELQSETGHTNFTIETPPSITRNIGTVFPELELSSGETGQVCYILNENAAQTITAPEGAVFSEVIFASYGNASGNCETGFTLGTCNASGTVPIIENLALGNNSFTILANNTTFGDPCNGVVKKLCLILVYTYNSYSWTNDNPAIGLPASGTGSIPSFEAAELGTANITLTATSARCAVSDPVTFTYTVTPPGPFYVDGSVSASGDGTSWATAFKTLQEALNTISGQAYPSDSILVAKGTYMPDVNQSFSMIEGVKIVGGFPNGGGERDIVNNITILKGNSNGYSVVRNSFNNLTPASVIDGFTITNGIGNGAMYNFDSSPTIRNCIFTGNQATSGGAIYNHNSSPVIINSIFSENTASSYGGAMYSDTNSSPVLINCIFLGNTAQYGGVLFNVQSPLSVYNSTFYGNTATGQAGLLYNSSSNNTKIVNAIAWNNGGNSIFNNGSGFSVTYTNIQGGYAGMGNIDTDPQFVNPSSPAGNDGIWGTDDDGLILQPCSPSANSGNNTAYTDAGGSIETDLDLAGNPRLYGEAIDMGAYETQSACNIVLWTINNEWLNGIEPDETKDVFIEGNLNVGTDYESFSAESLTVEESGSLMINEGNSVTVHGRIVNNAAAEDFLVKSGANLIQTPDYENNDNSGAITVERESSPIKRLDYTIWSSPVDGQQIQAFSPMTLPNRIYTYEGTNGFVIPDVSASFEPGKGYMFRAPNNWDPDTPTVFLGKFTGVPFNGDITIATHPGSFTSVGNPYPSNIDAYGLLDENPGAGTLYFWTNTFPADGNGGYTGNNYLTYTKLGGTIGIDDLYITTGQGFIVLSGISQMTFTNNIRISSEGQFYKTEEDEKHRFWLKFSGDQDNEFNRILIGYMSGATNQEDNQIDGEMFSYDGTKLFSIIDEREFSIQGRQLPFDASDTVPLGIKIQEAGKYKISLSNYDGLFAEGNITIYIKDKALHIIHNLMESDYEFESLAGEFNNRFEIVYGEESIMGTDDPNANSIRIYKDKDYIVVESEKEKILSVELYDLSGRNIHRNDKVNANVYKVRSALKGIIIVKAQAENGEIETRKVINK